MNPGGNPYVYDRPAEEAREFVGRWDLVDDVAGRVRRGESFAVLGGTRLGKTSLLIQIKQRIEEQPEAPTGRTVVPVFLSTHQFGKLTRARLFSAILAELEPHLRDSDIGEALSTLRRGGADQDQAFDLFFDDLRRALARDDAPQLFVMLDEVDELRFQDWSKGFFSNLRFLISQSPLRRHVNVLIAGTLQSADLWNTAGSPFYNVVSLIEMRLLEDADLRTLLGVGFAGGMTDDVERALLAEVGGHPYLAQYLLHRLWTVQHAGQAVDRAAVERAGRAFLRERKGDFQRWWSTCSADARSLFREVCHSRDRLKKRTAIEVYGGDVDRAEDALDQLVVNGLVREAARNRFVPGSRLFARWAMERIGGTASSPSTGSDSGSADPDDTAGGGAGTPSRKTSSWRETAELPLPSDLGELLAIWNGRRGDPARVSPPFYRRLGRQLLGIGEPLVAFDVFTEGLERWPEDRPLRQLLGLALSASGAAERANRVLQQLVDEGYTDGETLAGLARTHRALADRATVEAQRDDHLASAARLYQLGFRLADDDGRVEEAVTCGVRAASLALLQGDGPRATSLAERVQALGTELLDRSATAGADRFAALAALGESALLLGRWEEAAGHYGAAAAAGRGRYAELGTARDQAIRLLRHLGRDPTAVQQLLRVPPVAVFRGHPCDGPDRSHPRFPAHIEGWVAGEIERRLERIAPGVGYASATCGADLLFAEAMLRRGAELHLVLPAPADEFRAARIEMVEGAGWGERFDRVHRRATSVQELGQRHALQNRAALEYAGRVALGLAQLRAGSMGGELIPMAVWDGVDDPEPGSTAASVALWRARGLEPELVSLASPTAGSAPPPQAEPGDAPDHRIVAMLFADVVRFSRLDDLQLRHFADRVYGEVAAMIERSSHPPVVRNTWGDALYLVFHTVNDAGLFALQLADYFAAADWTADGLPRELNIRIGLHAGPTHAVVDPLTGQYTYMGAHVSRAARIEQITPPGSVYASAGFAALAAADGVAEFACTYVGRTRLPKGYGTFPTYHVHRT